MSQRIAGTTLTIHRNTVYLPSGDFIGWIHRNTIPLTKKVEWYAATAHADREQDWATFGTRREAALWLLERQRKGA